MLISKGFINGMEQWIKKERETMEQMEIKEEIEKNIQPTYRKMDMDKRTDMVAWLVRNPDIAGDIKFSTPVVCQKMGEATGIWMDPGAFQKFRFRIYPDARRVKNPYTKKKKDVNLEDTVSEYVKALQMSVNLLHKRVHRIESELGLDKL